MKSSLLLLFAVIAATSALRLPVGLRAGLPKIIQVPLKPIGSYEDQAFESEDMADIDENVVPEAIAAEAPQPPIAVPDVAYESKMMMSAVPEAIEPLGPMTVEAPRPPIAVQTIMGKIGNVQFPKREEIAQADSDEYENKDMDDSYEHKDMADQPYESADMKDEYENQAMEEDVQEQNVANLLVKYLRKPVTLYYESQNMADPLYETKNMVDQPYESVDMKDEYESDGMADLAGDAPEPFETAAMEDLKPEPRGLNADGEELDFGMRFAADGADPIFPDLLFAAFQQFAAERQNELLQQVKAYLALEAEKLDQ